jgi:hypothetical protein
VRVRFQKSSSYELPAAQTSVGRDAYKPKVSQPLTQPQEIIIPSDVTFTRPDGVRFFLDGALVGLWRSLRAQRVLGPTSPDDPDIVGIAPNVDGSFVPVDQSAATWAEIQCELGMYVICPIFLAYDTAMPRYLWKSRNPEPARGNESFVILAAPFTKKLIQELANVQESGG